MNEWKKAENNTFNWDNWWASSQKWGFNSLGVIQTLDDKGMELKMAIPGIDKKDIDVTLAEGRMEVVCEVSNEFVEPFKHEFSILSYDINSLKHSLVNGVLEIRMEKKEEFKPKKLKL